ncbi:MAG: hypothetical protein V7K90_02905 [Nostoc sp.]
MWRKEVLIQKQRSRWAGMRSQNQYGRIDVLDRSPPSLRSRGSWLKCE